MEKRILRISRINPHCGCSDKAFYVLFKVVNDIEEVMGRDEFPYKNEQEFQRNLAELEKRFNATSEIEPLY